MFMHLRIFITAGFFILSFALTAKTVFASAPNAKIKSGDTVYSILRRHGFNDNQRNAALGNISIPKDFVLSPGDLYSVLKDTKSGRTEIKFFNKKTPTAFTFWRQGQNAGAKQAKVKYDTQVVTVTGRIKGSLVESISRAVGDELIAYRFMDAFLLEHNLPRVLQKNAEFLITFEKKFYRGKLIRLGEVLRAEVEVGNQRRSRDFKQLKNGGVFLNPDNDYSDRPFYAPVDYIRISSLFQPRRLHPVKKKIRAHEGIDFELPEGEPVYAVNGGSIVRIGRNRAAGKYVVIRHAGGYESYYNHLSQLARLVVGQKVAAGTYVGDIGCTGYCTKPHLHFAIKKNGRFVNPISLVRNYSYGQKADIRQLLASARR